MTDALLSQIDDRSRALLYFVYGGMLMQEAARVHLRPYPPGRPIFVDAEDLFNAVEALGNRATFEAAPFVSSWRPLIEQFDNYRQGDLAREIRDGLDQQLTTMGSSRLADTLASAILSRGKNNLLQHVAADMVAALKGLLAIDTDRIDYLAPLVELHTAQDGGLLIASLNYDTLIEQIGAESSIQVDDCLDQWSMSGSLQRSDALTLLKLHGSINWVQDRGGSVRHAAEGDRLQPALIFGGINKLRVDGPYLDMLMEWRSHLDQSDHLIIIGYSFRDTHVNTIIERWHRQDRLKRVTVVDPGFGGGRQFSDTALAAAQQ
jgi:SIR2-like domain